MLGWRDGAEGNDSSDILNRFYPILRDWHSIIQDASEEMRLVAKAGTPLPLSEMENITDKYFGQAITAAAKTIETLPTTWEDIFPGDER